MIVHHAHVGKELRDALPRFQAVARLHVQAVPERLRFARGEEGAGLGEAVEMNDFDAQVLHAPQHRGGGGGAAGADAHAGGQAIIAGGVEGRQRHQHGWRRAGQRNGFALHQLEDGLCLHPAQADLGAAESGNGPDAAPAVGVEHRQGVQVNVRRAHGQGRHEMDGVDGAGAVRQHDALGPRRGAAGVVQRGEVGFVDRWRIGSVGGSGGQGSLVIHHRQGGAWRLVVTQQKVRAAGLSDAQPAATI